MKRSENQPGVTWLLPVKNGMPYLTHTLESIAHQNYTNHRIIAWDNGSTDGTIDLLKRWIDPEANVPCSGRLPGRLILNRPLGLGASLAAMVEMAQTEFCARIDADDINHPDRLSAQIAFMRNHPKVAVVGSHTRYIDGNGTPLHSGSTPPTDDASIRWRLRFYNAFNHPTVLFRRDAVLRVGNYRDIMPIEDFDLWVRLAMKYEMGNLPEPLVDYRILDTSVSARNHDRIDRIRDNIRQQYAAGLFPGLNNAQVAHLTQCITKPGAVAISLGDTLRMQRAAANAAQFVGKPTDYFHNTQLFKAQLHDLRIRWIKQQPGVNTIWNFTRHMRNRDEHKNASQRIAA